MKIETLSDYGGADESGGEDEDSNGECVRQGASGRVVG